MRWRSYYGRKEVATMRSVRLDDEMEGQLAEAARITGQPVSRIIRDAVAERCARLLGERLDRRLADVVGVIASDGGRAERTGEAFTALVKERRRARPR
jgi:predicted transcriptional regulator